MFFQSFHLLHHDIAIKLPQLNIVLYGNENTDIMVETLEQTCL